MLKIKEEKERYEKIHSGYCCLIVDYKTEKGLGVDEICNLLNKQEKVIKQLGQLQKQLAIEELDKALVLIQNAVNLESPEYDLVGLYDAIVDQIKSLKGEE